MTDERIERLRKTLRDSHVWDDLDSLERELTELRKKNDALVLDVPRQQQEVRTWQARALRAEAERDAAREVVEAARQMVALFDGLNLSLRIEPSVQDLRTALSHYDEVT